MEWRDLAGALVKAGAPILGTALGGPAGSAIGAVIGATLADALGVEATPSAVDGALAGRADAGAVVRQVEAEQRERWAEYMLAAQASQAEIARLEVASDHWFKWAWRQALSWLLIAMWGWNAFVAQVVSLVVGTRVDLIPYEHLLAFSGIWLTIYGGGHTLKSVLGGGRP